MEYEFLAMAWLFYIFFGCVSSYIGITALRVPVKETNQSIEYNSLEALPTIEDQAWLDDVWTQEEYLTPKTCFSDDDYYDNLAVEDATREVLSQSRLYNKMVTVGSRNVKGKWYTRKRRLIDLLLSPSGDLLEAVSPKVFNHLNGSAPRESVIIGRHCLGKNRNAGKVDIHTACDRFYSELGYQSAQDMLDEVEQLKELMRSIK